MLLPVQSPTAASLQTAFTPGEGCRKGYWKSGGKSWGHWVAFSPKFYSANNLSELNRLWTNTKSWWYRLGQSGGECTSKPKLTVALWLDCPFCHMAHFVVSGSTIPGWAVYFRWPGKLLLVVFCFYIVQRAPVWWWRHLVIPGSRVCGCVSMVGKAAGSSSDSIFLCTSWGCLR